MSDLPPRMPARVRVQVALQGLLWLVSPSGRRADLSRLRSCHTVADYLRFATVARLGYLQVEEELKGFVDLAAAHEPVRALEIGASWGGTTFALSNSLPSLRTMIGVDLYVGNRIKLKGLVPKQLNLRLINGNSRDPKIVSMLRSLLGGQPLDLLFIDGDHSYEGALSDFLTYRDLVRDGGLIAFHDIQSDGRERGVVTDAWSGGVPVLWRGLKPLYRTWEFIGSPDQFGYGIGVIEYSSSVVVPERELQRA